MAYAVDFAAHLYGDLYKCAAKAALVHVVRIKSVMDITKVLVTGSQK